MARPQNHINSQKTFTLNGTSIPYEDVLKGNIDLANKTEFETRTLTFIKSWFSGQIRFQLSTSGSTGTPKTIVVTREQMKKSALRTNATFQLKPGDTIFACLSTAFVAGKMMLVRAIEGDLNLIIESPKANPFAHSIHGKNMLFCALTPYQANAILDENPGKLAQADTILLGGAAINPTLEKRLQHIEPKVWHSYAMTETLTHVALRKVNGENKSAIYHALAGVSFSLDKRNCLIIHDRVLGIDGLITNDIVELIDEASFRWKGRIDNVINSGGIKIQVEEVENEIREILAQHGINKAFCLAPIPDTTLTNKMVLLIEHYNNKIKDRTILEELKRKLPKYHAPKELKQIPELILTKSGKIDRIRNIELYLRT